MDNPNYTTEYRKGQHLLNEERYEIEVRLKDGWSIYKIAKHLGRAYNTIKDEVERGTVTLYNGKMLRRFIPKGKPISSYTAEDICYFADCINGLPRKILGYRTPEELFEQELDKIYAA